MLSLTISMSVNAGNEVGNGGDVLICPKEKEFKPLLLDFFEVKKEGQFKLTTFEMEDEYQIVQKVISGLEKISPKLQSKYKRDLEKFRLKVKFVKGEELRDVKDSYEISLKKDCELKQIAIQRKNLISGDTEVFINKELYEKMSPLNKAGLILHEIIYEHFLFFKVQSSVKVRLFNRYLFSEEIKKHKAENLRKFSEAIDIPLY